MAPPYDAWESIESIESKESILSTISIGLILSILSFLPFLQTPDGTSLFDRRRRQQLVQRQVFLVQRQVYPLAEPARMIGRKDHFSCLQRALAGQLRSACKCGQVMMLTMSRFSSASIS